MRYFYNPRNNNKYIAVNEKSAKWLLSKGYKEISKEKYDEMEDIF
jgi:hypothetical protein